MPNNVDFNVFRSAAELCAHCVRRNVSAGAAVLYSQIDLYLTSRYGCRAETWPQGLALLATPQAAPTALALLNELVDEAWHAAGDRSADLSWCVRSCTLVCGPTPDAQPISHPSQARFGPGTL